MSNQHSDPRLKIITLGGLRIGRASEPVTGLASRKAEALLVYLACMARPLPREVLAEMLWDGRPRVRAMGNLRVLLSSLRQHLGPYVTIKRETVAFNLKSHYWLDVAELEEQLARGREEVKYSGWLSEPVVRRLESALDLYQGDFLKGFHVRDCRDFEEWVLLEQERLQRLIVEAHNDLARWYREQQAYSAAIEHTAHLLRFNPFRESAHRQMMRLLALNGQRGAALDQYETCRDLLAQELGVEPAKETQVLYEQIRTGEVDEVNVSGEGERSAA